MEDNLSPSTGLVCNYADGVFAAEPSGQLTTLTMEGIVAVHEAGHAVVGFALGLPCDRITLVKTTRRGADGGIEAMLSGLMQRGAEYRQRFNRSLRRGILDDGLYAHGVSSAAGPAAERKYRILAGLPLDMREATGGDRRLIELIAESTGQSDAYREAVWRRAQDMLDGPTFWRAVEGLAGALGEYWPAGDEVGTFTAEMPGPLAHSIMRTFFFV